MPSVTRSRRNGVERREAIENALLQATENLLAEGWSYTELPVQRIAEEAGIARSTFYVHFVDKGQLIARLADRIYDEIFAASFRWFAGDHRDGPDALAETLEVLIALHRRHFPVLQAVTEAASYEPTVGKAYRSRIYTFAAGMRARLEAARDAGQLNADVDLPVTAEIMCWMAERVINQHILERPESEDPALARSLARAQWLLMYGDARRPPARLPKA
jgi:TetR/AcrR family transcriptional regulator, ethionamide resistance regulator